MIPQFNDWEAADLLVDHLDRALADCGLAAEVLLVDDGSTQPIPEKFASREFRALRAVDILHLRRNLGHQRAIAVGLVHVYQNIPCRAVIVMDADGEDRPEDIAKLVDASNRDAGHSIVFAARGKRLEHLFFRFLYQVYRLVHRALTGDPVRVGNFSLIPFDTLNKVVVIPEIWNHYAAAVIRFRLPYQTVPIARGKRLVGKSKMNFIALLLHGLSAFFVYGDIVGARLLVAIALALLFEAGAIAVVGLRLSLTVYLAVILGIILLQAIPIILILVFTVVGSRSNIGFLPIRDCPYFVSSVRKVY